MKFKAGISITPWSYCNIINIYNICWNIFLKCLFLYLSLLKCSLCDTKSQIYKSSLNLEFLLLTLYFPISSSLLPPPPSPNLCKSSSQACLQFSINCAQRRNLLTSLAPPIITPAIKCVIGQQQSHDFGTHIVI